MAGSALEVWHLPAELKEPHDGPTLSLVDLVELHLALAEPDWFDDLLQAIDDAANGRRNPAPPPCGFVPSTFGYLTMMRRALTAVGAALVLALAAAPTTTAAAAGSGTKWVPTATRSYPSVRRRNWVRRPLPLRSVSSWASVCATALVSVPAIGSGHTMSTSKFVSAYAPTTAQVARWSRI